MRVLLDHPRGTAYLVDMTDRTPPTFEDMAAELEISEAEAAAGQGVPLEPILQRLHDHAERLEAAAAKGRWRRKASHP